MGEKSGQGRFLQAVYLGFCWVDLMEPDKLQGWFDLEHMILVQLSYISKPNDCVWLINS